MSEQLICIKCGEGMEDLYSPHGQPSGGLAFYSYGDYGSTFFDPMDGSYMTIFVCDTCLEEYKGARTTGV